MKKRNIIASSILAVAFILAIALNIWFDTSSITIEGRIIGARSNTIFLERHNGVKQNAIDTLNLQPPGDFKFKITDAAADPTLYELRCGDERIPILAKGGDRIKINTLGNIALNYKINGSAESELLRTFYQPYLNQANELRKVASEYASKQRMGDDTKELAKRYNELYQEIKRDQLKFIVTNKSSIASIYALMQYLPGDQYLINESSDFIYQRTVAEAVKEIYPESQYLKYLNHIITEQEATFELLNNVSVVNYPNIEMNDRFGKKISLSSLDGDVILLDFWSAELSQSNQSNAELKEIYTKYHSLGFEVYQVGVDNSKAHWINAIQLQRLPWISVSDLRGGNSPALRLYNITSLPANILISRAGDIVGRDLFGEELERAIEREVNIQPSSNENNK